MQGSARRMVLSARQIWLLYPLYRCTGCRRGSRWDRLIEGKQKGFIVREIDPDDRRYIKLILSDKARELEEAVNQTVLEVNQKVLKGYTKEETALFKSFLKRMIEI